MSTASRRARSTCVRAGERVAWEPPPEPVALLEAESVPYTIVYEDDWLLVVDKPAGVVVHPAPGHEHGTLAQGLVAEGAHGGHESRPGIVHRLDKDTSGLLIVSRRDEAYQALVAAMERRDIHRLYLALLVGRLPQDAGTIDAPIGRHLRDRKRMSLHTAAGKRAVTHFEVLGRVPGFTLVRVRLETGRTHQIRVHFSALGYPVAGDVQYGRPAAPRAWSASSCTRPASRFRILRTGGRSPAPARSRPTSPPSSKGSGSRRSRASDAPGGAAAARPPRRLRTRNDLRACRPLSGPPRACYSSCRPLIHVPRDGKGV